MKELKTVKKEYQRPSIRFESLQNHNRPLMASGQGLGKRSGYEADDDNPFGGGGSAGARQRDEWNDD